MVTQFRPAVFLDRDGVLNATRVVEGKPFAPRQLSEFVMLDNVSDAVRRLRAAGFLTIVVTNQPDVGHGQLPETTLQKMHEALRLACLVDDIRVCPHRQDERCSCRKPLPGLLVEAAHDHQIALSVSWMVGDRWSDVAAGQAAGSRTVFIDCGYEEKRLWLSMPDATTQNLPEAVDFILSQVRSSTMN